MCLRRNLCSDQRIFGGKPVVVSSAHRQARSPHRRAYRGHPNSATTSAPRPSRRSTTRCSSTRSMFFRGQHDLDDDGQAAFARQLGVPTTAHPTRDLARRAGPADRLPLRQGQQLAHRRHVRRPHPKASLLRAITLPDLRRHHHVGDHRGGVRPAAGALKALAENLWAVHTNQYDYVALRRRGATRRVDGGAAVPRGVRLRLLRDRASGGAGAPGDRQARAAARPFRQAGSSASARPSPRRCSTCSRRG